MSILSILSRLSCLCFLDIAPPGRFLRHPRVDPKALCDVGICQRPTCGDVPLFRISSCKSERRPRPSGPSRWGSRRRVESSRARHLFLTATSRGFEREPPPHSRAKRAPWGTPVSRQRFFISMRAPGESRGAGRCTEARQAAKLPGGRVRGRTSLVGRISLISSGREPLSILAESNSVNTGYPAIS